MKKLNWLQKFVAQLFRIVPFDIELALRAQLHRGIGIGLKQNKIYTLEPLPSVWIDETKRKHVQVQMSTYEPPQRTTEKPAVIPYPQGRYFQKRRKEFETTRLMPAAPRLARALDDLPSHAVTAQEDDWTNDGFDETVRRKAV